MNFFKNFWYEIMKNYYMEMFQFYMESLLYNSDTKKYLKRNISFYKIF